MSSRVSVRLMSLQIVPYPHPALRHRSKPIKRVDRKLRELAQEMLDLMYEASGVGLAANQVSLPLRMFVANPSGVRGEGEEFVLLNPEIQRPKGNEVDREGCLSLPEIFGPVKRPKQIRLSGYDLQGNLIERTVDGFLARILQHEYDHLNGVLFFDRMSEEAARELEDELDILVSDFHRRQADGTIPSDEELIEQVAQWEQRYA